MVKAIEFDKDIYTVALGHPIVKNGESWDAVEFYESFVRKINSLKKDLNSPNNLENKFFHYKADVKMCIKCCHRKETVDSSLTVPVSVVPALESVKHSSLMWNTAGCDYTDLAPSSFCECDHDVEEQGYQESSISSPEI